MVERLTIRHALGDVQKPQDVRAGPPMPGDRDAAGENERGDDQRAGGERIRVLSRS